MYALTSQRYLISPVLWITNKSYHFAQNRYGAIFLAWFGSRITRGGFTCIHMEIIVFFRNLPLTILLILLKKKRRKKKKVNFSQKLGQGGVFTIQKCALSISRIKLPAPCFFVFQCLVR